MQMGYKPSVECARTSPCLIKSTYQSVRVNSGT